MPSFDVRVWLPPNSMNLDSWREHNVSPSQGWAGLNVSLEEAHRLLTDLRHAKGTGAVADTRCRDMPFALERASALAIEAHRLVLQSGVRLGDLGPAEDYARHWAFYADNLDAQDAGLSPGLFRVFVDKLDGRVLTDDEYMKLKLSDY